MKIPFIKNSEDDNQDEGSSFLSGITLPPFLTDSRLFIALGLAMVMMMAVTLFTGSSDERNFNKAQEQAQRMRDQVGERVQTIHRLLQDEQVQTLASMALENPETTQDLKQYMSGRLREVREVTLYFPGDYLANPESMGEQAWILIDMLMVARDTGTAPTQMITIGGQASLATMKRLGEGEEIRGYLLVLTDPEPVISAFDSTLPASGYMALMQNNGRYAATSIRAYGDPSAVTQGLSPAVIPGSLLRVVIPAYSASSDSGGMNSLLMFLVGAILMAFGFIKRRRELHPLVELKEDPAQLHEDDESPEADSAPMPVAPVEIELPEEPLPANVELRDLPFNLKDRKRSTGSAQAPVELSADIFRAYDIRGIVGKSLDAGVARQIGQAIGSEAMERGATPVMVARDGRHSGPDLVQGLIEGLTSTGCDVINIGAVPTGVLYYAAYEEGSGSGVMVTGSHNPPDYNGLKVMLGGQTLAQENITALYERIESGNLRFGAGGVIEEDRVVAYCERIASDIQLERPLKIVADCGNGIGGVCAVEALIGIGAKVMPMYDEVDGDFPNHHPDPSEPENLEDLIETVKLMKADLGVAFDGDADWLGVVTPDGEIIYSDRLMMLFSREVLSRNPGGKIIYDVKCTGRLDGIIREAGGEPEMYKTGHSLIKNRMKEVDAPFAGEMSGHFFFKDRWYGFDCGIYSAARLLEILALDERSPEQVLGSLPTSVSTPELKVHMSEGENHTFVKDFQEKASFADARISNIDGVRADFEYGWGLVRASNTTPILVVRFEADSEESLQIIQEMFRMQMLAIRDDLELPF